MDGEIIKIKLNTAKTLLSGSRRAYKSEGFIAQTRRVMAIDCFISRTAESVFYEAADLAAGRSYCAVTADGSYSLVFYVCRGGGRLCDGDLVFYRYICANEQGGGADRSLSQYLLSGGEHALDLKPLGELPEDGDMEKLYLVSGGDGALNFPLLSEEQLKIVETENANVLVQGVAGSGKTNVCVEKIVYCACRGYRGRTLYTTYSRGLLTETKNRVYSFIKNVESFLEFYEKGNAIFLDGMHGQAVENKLGIPCYADDDAAIYDYLAGVARYLKNNVDYFLIEDIYAQYFPAERVVNEQEFMREYVNDKGYRLSGALDKIKSVAPELIYKEIFGMIYGKYDPDAPAAQMSREQYAAERAESFTRAECDVIYTVACDYAKYLQTNKLTDNNFMSRRLLERVKEPVYSVAVVDEAQDFTQVNLYLIKKLSRKLFCVGDALQMINPAYFSFGYVKRLMYGDVTGVSELTHNFRQSRVIEDIADELGEINKRKFGTHSFVLKGESVPSSAPSAAVFVKERDFYKYLTDGKAESVTIIVSSAKKKQELKKRLTKFEILTVSEAKGLERNAVILLDVLTDDVEKWNRLEDMLVNRKTADENSVYRYYFNAFYVGISRARQYLLVAEGAYPKMFEELFKSKFEVKSREGALQFLKEVAGKTELDDEEICDRIEKFCSLEQYENARFAADRLFDEELREEKLADIYVHENFLRYGRVRDAGIEYWRRGYDKKAREAFTRSGDEELFPLMDACASGGGALGYDIVKFYPALRSNPAATALIEETIKSDLERVLNTQRNINSLLKGKRRIK